MGRHSPGSLGPASSWRGVIEINIRFLGLPAAEISQNLNELGLIIYVAQAEAGDVGDQVVSVDQVCHSVVRVSILFLGNLLISIISG